MLPSFSKLAFELSPSNLGPVTMYANLQAKNLENAWQYIKVYPEHFKNKRITAEHHEWALRGWSSPRANKFPMGRDKDPLFYLWDTEKLSEVEARKQVYIPLYKNLVENSEAYKGLKYIYEQEKDIVLIDNLAFDYLDLNITLEDYLNDSSKPFTHSLVLALMLENLV